MLLLRELGRRAFNRLEAPRKLLLLSESDPQRGRLSSLANLRQNRRERYEQSFRNMEMSSLINLHVNSLSCWSSGSVLRRGFHPTRSFMDSDDGDKEKEKVGIVAKFKKMAKDYWYILIPVHCFTSCFWAGGFYILCKSGIDVPAILQSLGTSQEYLDKINNSEYAYIALAYACYKVATPARYTVTVGGTTMAIKYLHERGYLKSSSKIASEMRESKDELKKKMEEKVEEAKERMGKKEN